VRPWLLLLLLLLLALEPPAVVRRGRERPIWLTLLLGAGAIGAALFAIVDAVRTPIATTPPPAPVEQSAPLDPLQLLESGKAPVDLFLAGPQPAVVPDTDAGSR